ncbi:MAG: 30S ribosomal protein S13 [Candidatus Micrarchaeales archaeon]|jgi:small subunit ribosomal protein S13
MAQEQKEQKPTAQKARTGGQQQKASEAMNIVRIAGRDINGKYDIPAALRHIKGISHNLANAIALIVERQFGIMESTSIGSLEEERLAKLESVIKDPAKFGVPVYMLDRRKDSDTGLDMHLVGTDLLVKTRQDIDNSIKLQDWIGFRRQYGQKVRGQRTRSTGRTGRTVGVTKKRIAEEAKKKAAPARPGTPGEKKEGGQPAAAAAPAAPAPAQK